MSAVARVDRITRAIDRHSWALWMVLIGSLGLAAAGGLDPAWSPQDQARIGVGYVVGDWIAAVLTAWASIALLLVRWTVGGRSFGLVAIGDWLQLLALAAAGVRITWMLAVYGDAVLSLTALVALCAFALSSLAYSAGRLMRAGGCR